MDAGFAVPEAAPRTAYLFEKGMDRERLSQVMKEAMEARRAGGQILVAQMNKNKKFLDQYTYRPMEKNKQDPFALRIADRGKAENNEPDIEGFDSEKNEKVFEDAFRDYTVQGNRSSIGIPGLPEHRNRSDYRICEMDSLRK